MFERARLRLALSFAAAFALILGVLGVATYRVMANELDREIDRTLAQAEEAIRVPEHEVPIDRDGPVRRVTPPRREFERPPGIPSDVFFLLVAPGGEVLANSRNLDLEEFPLERFAAFEGELGMEFEAGGERYRVRGSEYAVVGEETIWLVVGRSLEARDYQLRLLVMVLAGGAVAGAALTLGGGWWLAGRALVPIRRSLETQRRFVSDASHELRTPVAVMKANAELLLRHPDQTVEANIDQVAAINEEADHLTRLVGDLLTLARADEQRLEVTRERVDFGGLVESVVRDMDAVAEARGIRLTSELAGGEVTGDAQRLRQLVAILLDNALKFTPAGGSVRVTLKRSGSRWTLSVADTGPGIPAEAQGRVFDRFFRVDESRTQAGTGLGLSIARWIAEAHHGRISVQSVPGVGSTFTVTLPD